MIEDVDLFDVAECAVPRCDIVDRCGADLTDPYVAEVDVLDRPAAQGIDLQAQRLV